MKPKFLIIHHSASSRDRTTLSAINFWHKQRGFPKSSLGWYIGYHYVITGNGMLYQTRKENEMGAHARANGMNYKSIGICLTGNFEIEKPSTKQLNTLKKFIENHPNLTVLGHNQIPYPTACPGQRLLEWINNYKSNQSQSSSNDRIKKIKSLLEEALKLLND